MITYNDPEMASSKPLLCAVKTGYLADRFHIFIFVAAVISTVMSAPSIARQHTDIDAIRTAARQFIVTELSGGAGEQVLIDTTITIKALDPRLRLASCAENLQVYKAPGTRLVGHSTVGVRCASPQAWSLYVPVHIEKQVPVLSLNKPLSRGEIVTADALVVRKRSSASIPVSYLRSGETLIGQQAVRDLMPGVVLTRGMFRPKKLVRRGDRVTLSMKSGLVAVRVSGIAMADGARGERIKVKNLSSKRTVDGTVSGENLVLVDHSAIR